ncbi:hypothetical protein GA0074695_4219 [Micromonospora viridifaciens]|uniref:Uncharacterized protein n=1 Tax=Micromonospora viridifaciens TaxID=1881 RepID=A0A1C4YFB9_MICVI|nr:hypothetical protein GA0074695_4219 [Micromonospora viridifaciens]
MNTRLTRSPICSSNPYFLARKLPVFPRSLGVPRSRRLPVGRSPAAWQDVHRRRARGLAAGKPGCSSGPGR